MSIFNLIRFQDDSHLLDCCVCVCGFQVYPKVMRTKSPNKDGSRLSNLFWFSVMGRFRVRG